MDNTVLRDDNLEKLLWLLFSVFYFQYKLKSKINSKRSFGGIILVVKLAMAFITLLSIAREPELLIILGFFIRPFGNKVRRI